MAKISSSKRNILSKKVVIRLIYVLILVVALAAAGFFFKKYDDLKNASPEKIQQSQTDQYIAEVGKLYALPKEEKPDVATVKDKEALKKQYPFFDQAENNDVVLIYKDAKLAILYRPAVKQLIKVGPVNIENGLSIRTIGSDTERKAIEQLLTDNKLTFASGGAAKTAVSGIVVVDLKGTNSEQAKKLAEIVKGKVGTLPEGEDKPTDADLLIIAGPVAP
jgi:hypothetical protein